MDKTKRQMNQHLPDRIKLVRNQKGPRSQRQFARDLKVFQQNVNRYESGTMPHIDFLQIVAVKEGISLDWLVYGFGRMKRGRAA